TVKRGRQVDVQNCIPPGSRKLIDRGGELDAGIVHQDVETTESLDCRGNQSAHGIRFRHVGTVVDGAHAVVTFDTVTDRLDLDWLAEAVQDKVGAEPGQFSCNS